MKKFMTGLLVVACLPVTAQETVHGTVTARENQQENPLPGAYVRWIHTQKVTVTDVNGKFHISADSITDRRLVISFLGYENDTVEAKGNAPLKIVLKGVVSLKTFEVVEERDPVFISSQPLKTEIILEKELKKAACCNLGESFETNASVDITYKDAVSGSKELQVLGLSGAYTQLLTENVPLLRGLGLTYGLSSVPGTQIAAINIVKGPGPVIFGHESISGMVNVDLKDPMKMEKIFINGFVDQNLRKELNVDQRLKINENLSSLLSFHADHFSTRLDNNKDGFTDAPLLTNLSLLNKWKFNNGRGWMSQNSVKGLYEDRMGGQTKFDFGRNSADSAAYGQRLETKRMEAYGRTGYVIPSARYRSVGLQYAGVYHDQHGFYGFRKYSGSENYFMARAIYNQQLNEYNSMDMGADYRWVDRKEIFDTSEFIKRESVPGIFAENTFKKARVPALVTGIRADLLNGKVYVTPRMSLKYSLTDKTDLRFSLGSGFRTSDILAENPNILASSRKIIVEELLQPEKAYNAGLNILHNFRLFYRKGSVSADFYHTEFSNKIIPDYDTDGGSVIFRNLDGRSFSENIQVEFSYEVIKKLDLRIAYKYLDVFAMSGDIRIPQPFIAKHRALATLFYEPFNEKWNVNVTWQWYGAKKLPPAPTHHAELIRSLYSDPYSLFNAQFTRVFKRTEFYIGLENILNFMQHDPILSADDPYGPYFDTSYIWGPMDGRKIYAGFRFKISEQTSNN